MASSIRFLSAIFMLSVLHSSNATPSKLVQDFCGTVNNPGSCLSALELDPKSGAVSTYHDLVHIALNLAISNTTNSKNFLESSKGKYNSKAINECIQGFTYAEGTFGIALNEVDVDAQTAGYDAAVAHDGSTQCVTGFTSAKIQIPREISIRVGYVDLYSTMINMITTNLQ